MNSTLFSKKEEIAHAITHGVGALLSIVALVFLIIFSSINGDPLLITSVSIFGSTMLLMYISSTLVHSLPTGKGKNIFLIIDHASIYFFIAGTYTPLLLMIIKGTIGWTLFGIVWGLALLGTFFKIFFVEKYIILSTLFYIVMGWLIVFAWGPLTASLHQSGLGLLIAGGVFYTVGSVFYVWKRVPYHHVIWHIFVIIGSILHFFVIFLFVI